MGKRKSRTKVVVKKKPSLTKVFDCLFCDHTQCVEVSMKNGVGSIKCRSCNAGNDYPIIALSKPIDVYYNWLDEVHKVNQKAGISGASSRHKVEDDDDEVDEIKSEEEDVPKRTKKEDSRVASKYDDSDDE